MELLCAHCGFHNPPQMRFCGNCGTRLSVQPGATQPLPSLTGFSPERLGVTMGADLLERFRQAGLEATGQHRNVTILFVDLAGYTELSLRFDSEDIYDLVQQYTQLLVKEVYKYEGIVDKLTGDGLMALFGAPIAHENNAERAVRAALDMQASVRQLSAQMKDRLGTELYIRVGLNSGSVVVGSVGSDLLMDYTAIGDTVNLANRFQEAANPGSILVSESVYRQSRALFDFQLVPNLQLKGISRPVPGYRVVGLKPEPGSVRGLEGLHAPMVGRDEELNQLKDAVSSLAHRRQGQFVIVVGEAGIGKSRLLNELKRLVDHSSIRVLEGHSLTYRRSVSYWIFLDLFRGYLEVSTESPEAEVSKKLTQKVYQVLGFRAAELLPYLEHLLSIKPSDAAFADRISYLDASQLRQQIFLAVRDLLIAEARRRPLLLILEDLHWADEASLDLLQFLLDSVRQSPLLILAVTRPIEGGTMTRVTAWAGKHLGDRFNTISLHSLSLDQSESLLLKLLALPTLPENLREQILNRAAGVPFYLEEILRMFIDHKVIQREDGHWRIVSGDDSSNLGVPDSLQGLILARFDRLDGISRRTLQIASVVGHHFTLPILYYLMPQNDHAAIRASIKILIERDFVSTQNEALVDEFTFRHVLMSEAIYGTLLKRERSKLHGQVGEAIEALYPNRIEEQIELLARHYSWSPCLDRALHYLILAGQKAARSYVTEQARQNYSQALALLPQVEHTFDQALQVHMGLGDVLVLTGEYQAARDHYNTAEKAILEDEPVRATKERVILFRKIATTYERQGDYDQALHFLAEAQNCFQPVPEAFTFEQAEVYNEIGWINFRRGNLDAAETFLADALALVEGGSHYDLTASIYNRLGGIYFQKGQLEQASHFVRKSLVLREEIGDIVAVARSYNNLGLLGWRRGDWDGALANFMHSVDLHANLGDIEGVMELHSNLGLLQIDRGNSDEAKRHLQAALSAAQQIGHTYVIGITYLHFSHLYLSIADWNTALEYSNLSLPIVQEIGDIEYLVNVYINIGVAWLGLGDLDQAERWGMDALELIQRLEPDKVSDQVENRGRALRLLGNAARLRGCYPEAGELLRDSAAIFTTNGNQLEQGRSSYELALLAAARGDYPAARVLFSEARLIFRQLGARLDLGKLEQAAAEITAR